jgi:hypothetical protein
VRELQHRVLYDVERVIGVTKDNSRYLKGAFFDTRQE